MTIVYSQDKLRYSTDYPSSLIYTVPIINVHDNFKVYSRLFIAI